MQPGLNEIAAVVLAGGMGTRVQHLLPGLPKPMAAVLGRPFLDWVVRYLAKQGIREVVLSTGHLAERVEGYFQEHAVEGVTVRCVTEERPMGTAGGFLHAAIRSGIRPEAWLVVNGDSLVLTSLQALWESLTDPGVAGAVLAVSMPDASRYGTVRSNSEGDLVGFEEKLPGAGMVNAGVYLWRREVLDLMPSARPLGFERDVFPGLIARKQRVKVCLAEAPFLDIGTPESLPQAESFVRSHRGWFLE